MKNLKNAADKISKKIGADKKTVIVVFLGIAGVILLVLSELIPSPASAKEETEQPSLTAVSCAEYEKEVETRLEGIISQISGAGKVSVMVTLESTVESVYARQEKQSGGENKISESEYVIIKTDGGEGGILLKTTQPEIRGVAVVCSGGGSAVVRRDITDTVTAVLGISAARVNITAMKKDNGG